MTRTQDARPLISFVIGGAQKCGTSALAEHLRQHPELGLPARKEAHIFDSPDFDRASSVTAINRKFAPLFRESPSARLYGDATPVTLLKPKAIKRIASYNPNMRWILLFRDPVARAVSHHAMQRSRNIEQLTLFLAVLAEPWRLRFSADPDLESRIHSYVLRGRYSDQLDTLYQHFPKKQVLLLRSRDLLHRPDAVLSQVCTFLGIDEMPGKTAPMMVFKGNYSPPFRHTPGMLALRWRLRNEKRKLAKRHGLEL